MSHACWSVIRGRMRYSRSATKAIALIRGKLVELLRSNLLRPFIMNRPAYEPFKELARSYLTITKDLTRVMTRLRRSTEAGPSPVPVSKFTHRVIVPNGWQKISEAGVRRRAETLLPTTRRAAPVAPGSRGGVYWPRQEAQRAELLRQIPSIGPIRAVLLLRRSSRHRIDSAASDNCGPTAVWRWKHATAGILHGAWPAQALQEGRSHPRAQQNHNHDLKNIFKGAAIRAAAVDGPSRSSTRALLAKGMKSAMARLTLARKIAAITLIVWKKGVLDADI